ncbi:recombinase family protein [Christensenella timonensis]|uniref:recombinase family protein n=1 Tax=Christensenella timonensis TaxID=1816678 RepID=UPI00082EB1AF|nr:recombinase family protein [Christensenella timonensis]
MERFDKILRVIILYRVSTKGQLYKTNSFDMSKDEIPMQKEACHKFLKTKPNWTLIDEMYEKGISGSKISAVNRDAIQSLKERALNKEFDVLLVWKFDRLGRIESETPQLLRWFVVEAGIQMWSVKEGQRVFETSADTLVNYITFWQADTESKNTAIRIKQRMEQLKEQGLYTGGPIPLGFKAVHKGRINKKGHPIPDLVPDKEFGEVVRTRIFYRVFKMGYGAYIIERELREAGITGPEGKPISVSSIKRILRNKKYRCSIIEKAVFDKVQDILNQRSDAKSESRQINMQARASALLSGNIFCGHCGHRLSSNLDRSSKNAEPRIRYVCYHKTQKKCNCDGQSTYKANIVDEAIENAVRDLLSKIKDRPKESVIKMRYESKMRGLKVKGTELQHIIIEEKNKLEKLQYEIVKCLSGDSVFDSNDLSKLIGEQKERISHYDKNLREVEKEIANKAVAMQSILPAYDRFKGWAEEYESLPLEQKRAVLCELVARIELKRGYEVKIIFNVEYEQFCRDMGDDIKLLKSS